jgi:epoxide hydrolase-like predicted phosphatase
MIKAIIFDLGGVLVPERIRTIKKSIAEELGTNNLDSLLNKDDLKGKTTRGEISLLDLYTDITKNLDTQISPENLLNKHLTIYKREATKLDQDVMSIIESLKGKYSVACLTNTEIEIAQFNKKRGLFNHFNKSYISTEMGAMKPQPKIYLRALEDLACLPEEAIFIDNKLEYVDGAKDVGINGILFQSAEKLREELKSYNVVF